MYVYQSMVIWCYLHYKIKDREMLYQDILVNMQSTVHVHVHIRCYMYPKYSVRFFPSSKSLLKRGSLGEQILSIYRVYDTRNYFIRP